jgi:hypothetical protein
MERKRIFFSADTPSDAAKQADRLGRMEGLEQQLMDVAINEVTHIVNMETGHGFSLDDEDDIKKAIRLKDNATKTMLLLNRMSIYSMSKRGVLPKDFAGGGTERDIEQASKIVEEAKLRLVSDARFR